MTRFLFAADTHWGAGESGFKVQPKYDVKLGVILNELKAWMAENEPVDFVLHGGDMLHEPTHESIGDVIEHFDFPMPVHLCLGNHDLTIEDSVADWLRLAPQFFEDGSPNYVVEAKDCVIHVVPNQFCDVPYLGKGSNAHFLDEQIERLESDLEAYSGATQIILTHSPSMGVPREQSGLEPLFHAPPEAFTKCVTQIAEKYNVSCVLGAHSHVNMHVEKNSVHYVTVSSLVETPFEFKVFEVDQDIMRMTTLNLIERVGFDVAYNFDKTFAQGRLCDRVFEIALK